jgi:hypothetical protein
MGAGSILPELIKYFDTGAILYSRRLENILVTIRGMGTRTTHEDLERRVRIFTESLISPEAAPSI